MAQRCIAAIPNHQQPDTCGVKLWTLTPALKTYQIWPWSSKALKHMLYFKHVSNPIRVNEIQHKPLGWVSEYLGCGPDYVSDRRRNLGEIAVFPSPCFLFLPFCMFTTLPTIQTEITPAWTLVEAAPQLVVPTTLTLGIQKGAILCSTTLNTTTPNLQNPHPVWTVGFKRTTQSLKGSCGAGPSPRAPAQGLDPLHCCPEARPGVGPGCHTKGPRCSPRYSSLCSSPAPPSWLQQEASRSMFADTATKYSLPQVRHMPSVPCLGDPESAFT